MNSNFEVYTEQQSDGNLVVRNGSPSQPGDIVWESGYSGEEGSYFTRVLGNSNFVTYKGVQPEDIEEEVWQTETIQEEGLFFFGIDCAGNIGVMEGTPEDPGDFVWEGVMVATTVPTASPTVSPSELSTMDGTASPTAEEDSSPTTEADSTSDSTAEPSLAPASQSITRAPTPSLFVGDENAFSPPPTSKSSAVMTARAFVGMFVPCLIILVTFV